MLYSNSLTSCIYIPVTAAMDHDSDNKLIYGPEKLHLFFITLEFRK